MISKEITPKVVYVSIDPFAEVFKKLDLEVNTENLRNIVFTTVRAIVSSKCCVSSPNVEFFKKFGEEGRQIYEEVIDHLKENKIVVGESAGEAKIPLDVAYAKAKVYGQIITNKIPFSQFFHYWADKQSPLCIDIAPSSVVFKQFGYTENLENLRKISFIIAKAVVSSGVIISKLNIEFFDKFGEEGKKVYEDVVQYLEQHVLMIRDVERGKIGSTCKMHAETHLPDNLIIPPAMTAFAYSELKADGINPIIKRAKEVEGCAFLVLHSSHPSGEMLQNTIIVGKKENEEKLTIPQYLAKEINNYNQQSKFSYIGAIIEATAKNTAKTLEFLGNTALILVPQYATFEDIKINFAGHEKQVIPVISKGVVDNGTTIEAITNSILEYKKQAWELRMSDRSNNQSQNLSAVL